MKSFATPFTKLILELHNTKRYYGRKVQLVCGTFWGRFWRKRLVKSQARQGWQVQSIELNKGSISSQSSTHNWKLLKAQTSHDIIAPNNTIIGEGGSMQCSTLRLTNLLTRPKGRSFCGVNFFFAIAHLPLSPQYLQNANHQHLGPAIKKLYLCSRQNSSAHLLENPMDEELRIPIKRRAMPIISKGSFLFVAVRKILSYCPPAQVRQQIHPLHYSVMVWIPM